MTQIHSPHEETFVAYCRAVRATVVADLQKQVVAYMEGRKGIITQMDSPGTVADVFFGGRERRMSSLRMQKIRIDGAMVEVKTKIKLLPSDETFRRQYHDILAIPRVIDVRIEGIAIRIRTDILYGKGLDGRWYEVGAYDIFVDAREPRFLSSDTSRIRWIRHRGTVKINAESFMTTFRASRDGTRSCLGDAVPALAKALETFDYVSLAKIVVRFAECPGQYNDIRYWPRVESKHVPQWYRVTFGD